MHDRVLSRPVSTFPAGIVSRPADGGGILPLRAEGLRLTIAGHRLVDVDALTLRPGGPTMIMGPNGAGKSLLLRLLHGLIAPSEGKVWFDGRPMSEAIRRRQAMVFQRPVVLRRSVAANIDYALKAHGVPRAERHPRIRILLETGDFADRARQAARTLSGGEQQRLALLRAIATGPEILFLDEPTSSLDPTATQKIEALVREAAAAGTKIVMVTHDPGQARRLADEMVFVHRGRVTEQTPATAFFKQPRSEPARAFLAGGLVI